MILVQNPYSEIREKPLRTWQMVGENYNIHKDDLQQVTMWLMLQRVFYLTQGELYSRCRLRWEIGQHKNVNHLCVMHCAENRKVNHLSYPQKHWSRIMKVTKCLLYLEVKKKKKKDKVLIVNN